MSMDDTVQALDQMLEAELELLAEFEAVCLKHGAPPDVLEGIEERRVALREMHWRRCIEAKDVSNRVQASEAAVQEQYGKWPGRILMWVVEAYIWLKHNLVPRVHLKAWRQARQERKRMEAAHAHCMKMIEEEIPE